MLDKVPAPELVAATVANSIQPYAEEHDIPFDELLLQYIKVTTTSGVQNSSVSNCGLMSLSPVCIQDLLERCSSQTTTLFTEWEAKAVAVLGCMTDTDVSSYHDITLKIKTNLCLSNLAQQQKNSKKV